MRAEISEVRLNIGRGGKNIGRVPADDRKNFRVRFGESHRAAAALKIGAHAQDAGDAGFLRPSDYFGEFSGEFRIIQMRMGVVPTTLRNINTVRRLAAKLED